MAAVLQIVRFKSGLEEGQVRQKFQDRAPDFSQVLGLRQKYYVKYPNGEHGAVYIWESQEAYENYRQGSISNSISDAYKVEGDVSVELAELILELR